jgi:ATP-dependent Clp protease ATP-binding subunit ClpC
LAAIIVERRFPEGEQFLFVRSDGDGIQVEFVDPDADEAEEQPAAAPVEPTELSKIAAAILTPKGVPAEIQLLQAECEAIERTLASGEWNELKQTLSGEMAAADFWTRADRFGILARFALMDRVKTAAETASALRGRMARYRPTPRHHPAQLSGRFALQLHLIREGIKDVFDDAPVEVALAIEPALDGAGEHWGTLAWCERLMSMYRAWGAKRRMHIRELSRADEGKNGLILTVSGFGAYRTLIAEAGLHVFEPSESASGRVTARVSLAVVPLGDVPAAKERKSIVQALEQAPRENTVARRYREQPPLVRSGNGKWRSGRLDLVLGGDFDLLQAGAI